jgi:hypothetical protein
VCYYQIKYDVAADAAVTAYVLPYNAEAGVAASVIKHS